MLHYSLYFGKELITLSDYIMASSLNLTRNPQIDGGGLPSKTPEAADTSTTVERGYMLYARFPGTTKAQISCPEIIHRSTDTRSDFKGVRRMVLPWFVGVATDNCTLYSPDSDSWNSLATCHMKQTAPASSPSGHPNMYGKISFIPSRCARRGLLTCRAQQGGS